METNRLGRLIGLPFYLVLTVASFLMFADNRKAAAARTILFLGGMILLFFVKLINIPFLFGNLKASDTASVLNCVVYVLSQLGAIALVFYFITLRSSEEFRKKQTLKVVLSSIIVVFYLACLIMECIMLIKYRANIEMSLKLTFLSRFLYFFGFAGTAVCLMLPALLVAVDHKIGEFVFSEEDDNEIDLVI
ncbi:MAG: hypothetical protein IJV48_06245 [Ruminococcus sp.]|nr:hypothetical protein [Ruminococcus sp.]